MLITSILMATSLNVAVPMRDGVTLRADVYLPSSGERFPVLVYRTPYDKAEEYAYNERTVLEAVRRGYAVVVNDVRGRYASGGAFSPYKNEGKDGYDTIEWAAAQPWSTGSVGMFGLSYPGAVQWLAAIEAPPSLKAIVPAMSISTMRNFIYYGGVFDLGWRWWIEELMGTNPDTTPYYAEWLAHPPEDPYWDYGEIRAHYPEVQAAVLNLSAWYDDAYGPQGAIEGFVGMTAAGRDTALIMGPWVHGAFETEDNTAGSRTFAENARLKYDDVVLGWLDAHMKADGPTFSGPRVRVYLMGEDRWLDGETWPLSGVERRAFRLGRELRARNGWTIAADPAQPVTDDPDAYGAYDHRFLDGNPDVLRFETEPLTETLRVVGDLEAELFVESDASSFDLYVRVIDVAPDGTALNVTTSGQGILRVEGHVPGSVAKVVLRGMKTANAFLPGHKLRFQVTTSWAPWYPLNMAGPTRTVVHHDGDRASRLVLPILD